MENHSPLFSDFYQKAPKLRPVLREAKRISASQSKVLDHVLITRWQSRMTCAQLLRELQNYNLLLNNRRQENVGYHQKKITPLPRVKEKPQQDSRIKPHTRQRRSEGSNKPRVHQDQQDSRIKPHTRQRCSEGSNKPRVHQDPEIPQTLRQNCVWVSPKEVWVSSGLQGLWVQ